MSAPEAPYEVAYEVAYEVLGTDALEIVAGAPLDGFYQLSPYVWREGEGYRIALRAVNHAEDPEEKVSRVYFGAGEDGLSFTMDAEPHLAPSGEPSGEPSGGPDALGCEDPTVRRSEGGLDVVYSGWDGEASRLLLASGPATDALEKRGALWPDDAQYANPKEAAILVQGDGVRLLFEYARGGASRIGAATGPSVAGASLAGPFAPEDGPLPPREGHWDSWHLSPCDVVDFGGDRVAVYSGADRETRWRIGWAHLDESGTRVLARAEGPLIAPTGLSEGDTDIAFAASALAVGEELWIYYSVADRYLRRARVVRR